MPRAIDRYSDEHCEAPERDKGDSRRYMRSMVYAVSGCLSEDRWVRQEEIRRMLAVDGKMPPHQTVSTSLRRLKLSGVAESRPATNPDGTESAKHEWRAIPWEAGK